MSQFNRMLKARSEIVFDVERFFLVLTRDVYPKGFVFQSSVMPCV